MSRDDLLQKLRREKAWLDAQGIVNPRLFGSYARDEATPASDVDLLVEMSRPLGLEFLATERLLGERIGRPVEFCAVDVMHPAILDKAEREAVVV